PNFLVASNSLGYNFGNHYMKEGYQALVRGQKIPADLIDRLKDVFAFDVLISNSDRRIEKPNLLTNGRQELSFDNEFAFSFTLWLTVLRNKEPWLIKNQEMAWIGQNYCYDLLKGKKERDLSMFVATVNVLNPNFWHKVSWVVP